MSRRPPVRGGAAYPALPLPSRPRHGAPPAPRPVAVPADGHLDRTVALAFAPMYKLAFGVAIGAAGGLLVFAVTAVRLLVLPPGRTELALLAEFFAGYTESWTGAFVGLAWGAAVGFVAGWFTAFVRNLVCAVWLLTVRVRADLVASREFLDHI